MFYLAFPFFDQANFCGIVYLNFYKGYLIVRFNYLQNPSNELRLNLNIRLGL